jgi:hypothetical protein
VYVKAEGGDYILNHLEDFKGSYTVEGELGVAGFLVNYF